MIGPLRLLLVVFALFFRSSFQIEKASSNSDIAIGGLFNTFSYGVDGIAVKNHQACQHLAAFMMAIDEINDKSHEIYNQVLLNQTYVRVVIVPRQNFGRPYQSNSYFDGYASAYEVHRNNSNVIGVVETTAVLQQAVASASALNSYGSVAILSSSPSSVFNDAHVFPTTLQISATTYGEAGVLADYISMKLKWKYIVVFAATDVVAIDSYTSFTLKYPSANIAASFFISPGTSDLSIQIDSAKRTGATIFVIFMDGYNAGLLLEQGYNSGLFHQGTQAISTSTADINDIKAAFTPSGQLNEWSILEGFMTTAAHSEYYLNTPLGQSFISRFRKLPPTLRINITTQEVTCNQRTSINPSGISFFDETAEGDSVFDEKGGLCAGFESFLSFNQNGSNIDPTILYTYDAVYMYLIAANGLLAAGTDVTAANLYAHLVSNLFPSLVTGSSNLTPYRGTRTLGTVFKILNYQNSTAQNAYSMNGLTFVGEYTDAAGWLLCGSSGDVALMPLLSQSLCSDPFYRMNPRTSSPLDAPPPIVVQLPQAYRSVLIAFALFGLCTLAVWGVCLYFFWQTKQIRNAQPRIMVFLLMGGVLGLAKVLLSAQDISQASCVAQLWLSHFAFRFIFRTLLLKLWRINAVMNAGSFKRIIIAENTVLWYLLSDVVFMTVAILIPITIISYVDRGMDGYVSSTIGNQVYHYAECQVSLSLGVQVLNAILYFSDGLNLIMAIHYTYLTRTVPSSVNETSTVAPAVLGTVISIVVVAVVSYTTSLSSKSRLMIFNGAFLVVIIFGEGLYFGKKFLEIFGARRLGRAVHGGEHRSSSKNIERSFIEMVKGGNRGSYWLCKEDDSCVESDTHLLHELVRLIGMLKKAHTPEAKLRLCNEQVTQWKSMLMLISDNLVSTGTISTSTATTSDDKE